ncbi:unnamed protein product [Caenorhabditis auriculariae]|uniref:Nicotinate phosphoribosyltransferase n=1 Tax=Caenorhabditis auriculariae TaxID=2777116 RepID=A0A8S1HEB3_9PELO|nr:unnamed protein product [Caenorhabditis auriculariae]
MSGDGVLRRSEKGPSPSRLSSVSNETTYEAPWESLPGFSVQDHAPPSFFPNAPNQIALREATEPPIKKAPLNQGKEQIKSPHSKKGKTPKKKRSKGRQSLESMEPERSRPRINFVERARNSLRQAKQALKTSSPTSSTDIPLSGVAMFDKGQFENKTTKKSASISPESNKSPLVKAVKRLGATNSPVPMQAEDKAKKYRSMGMKFKQSYLSMTVQRMHQDRQKQFLVVPPSVRSPAGTAWVGPTVSISNNPNDEKTSCEPSCSTPKTTRAPKNMYSSPSSSKYVTPPRGFRIHSNDVTMLTAASQIHSPSLNVPKLEFPISMPQGEAKPKIHSAAPSSLSLSSKESFSNSTRRTSPDSGIVKTEPEDDFSIHSSSPERSVSTVPSDILSSPPTSRKLSVVSSSINDLPNLGPRTQSYQPNEKDMAELWELSVQEKKHEEMVADLRPKFMHFGSTLRALEARKEQLMSTKKERDQGGNSSNPSVQEMAELWNISSQEVQFRRDFVTVSQQLQKVENEFQRIRTRKAELLRAEPSSFFSSQLALTSPSPTLGGSEPSEEGLLFSSDIMSFVHPREVLNSPSSVNGLHMNGQDSLVQPLLTDLYQLTMCYAYWKTGTHNEPAVFDLFFRKNPFQGEFTIFAGLEDCLRFVENFKFSASDIKYLKTIFPKTTDVCFFDYLESLDGSQLRIDAIREGSVVFPKVPLLTVEGPLAVCQLLETTFLNLINYASLVATNAARFRQAAGPKMQLLEFGLRRAQGPNGGLTASKYCYVGGFDGTSNVLAGKLYGIPVKGTQAHSFISSFTNANDLKLRTLKSADGSREADLFELSLKMKSSIFSDNNWAVSAAESSEGELAAFAAYAIAFPEGFLALIDTYDTLMSGAINFVAVAAALNEIGYRALGCRIDSGDLSYLSKEVRNIFHKVANANPSLKFIESLTIVASNDINEETITSLNEQGHEINSFGVGTHLVTCQKQPALGCVYKLVAQSGIPKIKLSQEVAKISIPGRKKCYRLYGRAGYAIIDLLTLEHEEAPKAHTEILCRHPFQIKEKLIDVFHGFFN